MYGGCFITARKRSLRRLCFYRCLSVHRGEGSPSGGGVLHRGGSPSGGFSIPGGAPSGGVSIWGGSPSGGFSIRGGLSIRSMCGRYASYWNAFLLFFNSTAGMSEPNVSVYVTLAIDGENGKKLSHKVI